MDRPGFGREALLTITLPLAALLLNWLGMGSDALTLGRALVLCAYALLALFLTLRALFLVGRALFIQKRAPALSALLALLTLCLLLLWPFTPSAGRLNDRLYRPRREKAIADWQAGELPQVGAASWYVGPGSWDRTLHVEGRGKAFAFRAYNGVLWSCDVVYSPHSPPEEEDRLLPLGEGWYQVLWH